MTAFALPAKCGFFGASTFGAAARAFAHSSDASAALPTPYPQSRKKCRRVMSSMIHSRVTNSSRFRIARAVAVHAARSTTFSPAPATLAARLGSAAKRSFCAS